MDQAHLYTRGAQLALSVDSLIRSEEFGPNNSSFSLFLIQSIKTQELTSLLVAHKQMRGLHEVFPLIMIPTPHPPHPPQINKVEFGFGVLCFGFGLFFLMVSIIGFILQLQIKKKGEKNQQHPKIRAPDEVANRILVVSCCN